MYRLRSVLLLICAGCVHLAVAQNKDYTIKPVSFTKVKLDDGFWSPRIETNRTVTIPASFARCESTGRVKNFEMAAQKSGKFCTTYPFDDTDIYKTVEGASFSMAVHPDPKLDHYVDSLIAIVGKAQEPDGYLYTARTIDPLHPHPWSGPERWMKEHELSHELYNSGHLFEAASAHYQATGKRNFLNIALKNADLLVQTFGPGKLHMEPGHEIVEMGLVKLYRITGKKDYLDLAKFFIDERGKRTYDKNSRDEWKNGMYWQDDVPVINQDEAEGHAVRAMYLYSGMADVAALTGDKEYIAAIDKIWDNMVGKKIYVQGGIGAVPSGERFGDDYQLPNATAYNETCAAVGNVYWNERMFLLHGDAKYIDVMEKVLYNGLISGVGLNGNSFFYTNAMQVTGTPGKGVETERSGWFECSCCPTNLARFLPSLSGYMYAQKDDDLFVNLFIQGVANLQIKDQAVKITQQNNYPWSGALAFIVDPAKEEQFNVKIRIPGWVQNQAIPSDLYQFEKSKSQNVTIKLNGKPVKYTMQNGYAVISKTWRKNDRIEVNLPMEVKKVVANQLVKDDIGKVALQRGPVMYCAEWKDNTTKVSSISLSINTPFKPEFDKTLFNGVMVLKGETDADKLTLIPYCDWANRGKGEMQVWFSQSNM
ncbi:six-hairpin glycosidase [Mucilaginibacter sp. PPCGB 2223]|uniref:glycoside hydrolase family 127 protein n=1 Tax=Mucilaginibacter sp. PPCGB 2223 TaxID=1886027 RepID=UPI0008257650|nr:glycoside hydrolase family 127 protein [Mucilaginibacter sp. PPCGB 2223]OCX53416.1 six-hairpin glycosidase [Mucilaginibacter sp. PPCGB 2223]